MYEHERGALSGKSERLPRQGRDMCRTEEDE